MVTLACSLEGQLRRDHMYRHGERRGPLGHAARLSGGIELGWVRWMVLPTTFYLGVKPITTPFSAVLVRHPVFALLPR